MAEKLHLREHGRESGSGGLLFVSERVGVFLVEVDQAPGALFTLRRGHGGVLRNVSGSERWFSLREREDIVACPEPEQRLVWESTDPEARVAFHTADDLPERETREEYVLARLPEGEPKEALRRDWRRKRAFDFVVEHCAEHGMPDKALEPILDRIEERFAREERNSSSAPDFTTAPAEYWAPIPAVERPPLKSDFEFAATVFDGQGEELVDLPFTPLPALVTALQNQVDRDVAHVQRQAQSLCGRLTLEQRMASAKAQHLADFDRERETDRKK